MRVKVESFNVLHFLYPFLQSTILSSFPKTLTLAFFSSTASSKTLTLEKQEFPPKNATEIFRKSGCSDADITKLFLRLPYLLKSNLTTLQSKLCILQNLGFQGSDLIKIITRGPRILASRLSHGLDHRLEFLKTLFGSNQMLLKAIARNPSLLTYDIENRIKPCIALYQEIGINIKDLRSLIISHPRIVSHSFLNNEKLDYIHRIGLSIESKMYKYVVSLIAISRLETIREKVANFEKFGFSAEEVLGLFARSPYVLTLSVGKVQRNMTFVIGTMKLPTRIVLDNPFLVYFNLETVLKPRFLLAGKIQAMGLVPQIMGPSMFTAMRMNEPRFLRVFISSHKEDVAKELMDFYENAKEAKRLAQDSKSVVHKGFHF
ncbi:transcription termination factor MTERF8, chloroplastic-like [Tasmannia lanceolata]|uniref:transcription termination factor MTERF8, chloroplastic-like n=1 Tax=Tasmannia lanceolata TaxID=3420 RepID=UPI0040627D74